MTAVLLLLVMPQSYGGVEYAILWGMTTTRQQSSVLSLLFKVYLAVGI